jgi:hypothetical protein
MDYVRNLKPAQLKLLKHAASQIAGRKPRRTAPNFKVPREKQYRAHTSPYKDIANATKGELTTWLKEDAHHPQMGGGLHSAIVDSFDTMHKYYKDVEDKTIPHVKKIESTLQNVANTARVQVDVEADDFLHKVGLRHHKKYENDKLSDHMTDHFDLHRDAYKSIDERKGTGRFEYLQKHSTDDYGTYKDKDGKIVVAFRGTSPGKGIINNDFIQDVHVAAGDVKGMSAYKDYKNHVKNMIDEYGSGNVSLSGYSLGGSKAVQLTQDKELRSHLGTTVALSPGMSPLDSNLKQKANDQKIDYFYHHNDAVANSLLSHSAANHYVHYNQKDPIKAHMILN